MNPLINDYTNKTYGELQKRNMTLVDPMSLKNNGDPFVIMLALYLEGRDLNDLCKKEDWKDMLCSDTEELKEKKG